MISAKDRFREGYILLLRPFQFAELEYPLQKMTILWAYSEKPVERDVLTEEAREELDLLDNSSIPFMFNKDAQEEWLNSRIDKIMDDKKSYRTLYEGEIVQCIVEGQICRFYPEEYNILTKEKLFHIMQEEGYHTLLNPGVRKFKEFNDQVHYLRSRGVDVNTADKWASLSFPDMAMYKPYFGLLEAFCREHEIYPDKFYEEVEGISFEKKPVNSEEDD